MPWAMPRLPATSSVSGQIGADGSLRSALAKASRLLGLTAVSLAPLPFGSVEPIWIAVFGTMLATSLLLADLRSLDRQDAAALAPILALVAVYGGIACLQVTTLLPAHPIWTEAGRLIGEAPATLRLSVTAWNPIVAMGNSLVSVLTFTVAYLHGRTRSGAEGILLVLGSVGCAYAVYGMLSWLVEPSMLLWRDKRAYLNSLTATFINANTAGSFFGICSVLWLSLSMASFRRREPPWRVGPLTLDRRHVGAAAFLVCLTTTVLTGSRAGTISCLAGLVLAAWSCGHDVFPSRRARIAAFAVAVIALLSFLETGGGVLAMRLQWAENLGDLSRFLIHAGALRAVIDHPVLGTGLGNFAAIYPLYRSPDMTEWFLTTRAHNTLLEVAVDVGLPYALALGSGWIWLWSGLLRACRTRTNGRLAPAAGLGVATVAMIHSTVDFPLQIPGFAIFCAAILGVAWAQARRANSGTRSVRTLYRTAPVATH